MYFGSTGFDGRIAVVRGVTLLGQYMDVQRRVEDGRHTGLQDG